MPPSPISFRLDDVRGRNAVILIFAPSERSPSYENQIALLEEEDVASRMNATMLIVLNEGASTVDGERIDEPSADELRTSFGVEADEFLVVLIGADGKERHRDDAPLQTAAIMDRLSGGSTVSAG